MRRYGFRAPPIHGTPKRFEKGCRCEACKDAARAQWRRYRDSPFGIVGLRLSEARRSAKKKGVPFNLTRETIPRYEGTCRYCDRMLEAGDENGGRGNAPSLDRIDPALGYVDGNVVWTCHDCNRRKADLSPDDLYSFAITVLAVSRQAASGAFDSLQTTLFR